MKGLIAIGFRVAQPVAQTVGMALVDFADGHIDVETLVDFVLAVVGGENDANSQNVVYLVEGYMLILHLIPNGIWALHTHLQLVFHAHLVERLTNRSRKLVEQYIA